MAQTYCTQSEVEDILSTAGATAFADDDEGGTLSAGETAYITAMIERAAVRMNAYLTSRYTLSELASNAWCKWCNATLAAYYLVMRRGNPAIESVAVEVGELMDMLTDIKAGRMQVPEQSESFDFLPTVTNFDTKRRKTVMPVRVRTDESTGDTPHSSRKRRTARQPYDNG